MPLPDTTAAAAAFERSFEAPGDLFHHVERVGKWAIALAAVVGLTALTLRGVKRSGRVVVLWLIDAEVQKRTTEHGELRALLEELDRKVSALEGVGERVDFIAKTLIAKALE